MIARSATLSPLIPGSNLTAGLFLGILAAIGFAFLMRRTAIGFQIRAVGQGLDAAAAAGISTRRTLILSMALSGALAGLGGAIEVIGVQHRFIQGVAASYGFDGIAVALLGGLSGPGVVLSALFFGALAGGASYMQLQSNVPDSVSVIVQALVILLVGIRVLFVPRTSPSPIPKDEIPERKLWKMPPSSAFNAFLTAAAYSATPLVLAAMGGVFSERAGVVNIALEGLILAGAFAGVCAEQVAAHWMSGAAGYIGLMAALGVGALLGLLHAFLTQHTRMNHVVSGLGINLLAAGLTRTLYLRLYPSGLEVQGLPGSLFLGLAVVLPFLVWLTLSGTRFGLRLRAVGESPESARMAGIAPAPLRYAAVTLSGMLGALAGAYLSMADAHTFSSNMSAGKGYIALAAVIFGKWKPLGAALGALFFGLFYALQTQFQISGIHIRTLGVEWTSPFLLDTLPYFMTLAALVSVVGRALPPAALGQEEG